MWEEQNINVATNYNSQKSKLNSCNSVLLDVGGTFFKLKLLFGFQLLSGLTLKMFQIL